VHVQSEHSAQTLAEERMLLHSNADIAVSGRNETIAIDIKRDEELQG
jgi:hypothetical protein